MSRELKIVLAFVGLVLFFSTDCRGTCKSIARAKTWCLPSAIPSFFEIKESDGSRNLSKKNRI